jgi:hypothetical protein
MVWYGMMEWLVGWLTNKGDVKHRIYERGGPSPALQVLLWGGVEADDFQCVSEVEQRREPVVLATQAPRGLPPSMMASNGQSPLMSPSSTMIVRSSADLSLAICGPKGCGKSAILSYLVGHISGTRTPQRHLVIAGQDFDVEVQGNDITYLLDITATAVVLLMMIVIWLLLR